jgi:hypothetical protein
MYIISTLGLRDLFSSRTSWNITRTPIWRPLHWSTKRRGSLHVASVSSERLPSDLRCVLSWEWRINEHALCRKVGECLLSLSSCSKRLSVSVALYTTNNQDLDTVNIINDVYTTSAGHFLCIVNKGSIVEIIIYLSIMSRTLRQQKMFKLKQR